MYVDRFADNRRVVCLFSTFHHVCYMRKGLSLFSPLEAIFQ